MGKHPGGNSRNVPHDTLRSSKLLSRDVNYLCDLALFWPFVIFLVIGAACLHSTTDRQLGLRSAGLAFILLLLSKEKLLLSVVAMGLITVQSAIALLLHSWSWQIFTIGALTAVPFLLLNRYWRKPKLAYSLPDEFGFVDIMCSVASLCVSFFLFYLINPSR